MLRADPGEDIDGWYHVIFGRLTGEDMTDLEDQIRWCKLHVSDGRFDYGVQWGSILFYFEQLEDALMFRLIWDEDFG
jgi:hypothetical protein